MLKANIGTGMLSMPVVFKLFGLWVGLLTVLLAGALSTYCMKLLIDVGQDICTEYCSIMISFLPCAGTN
ncbi:hypothetical protein Ciccas_014036 [Cichlidogyrus casuarinus]|uniref:Amino acid transporter transmembrane domain-containing protein n=1 Tax=Cichlidogyrus casuarinus TaxID=1844966 RepID=A0ABD2PJ24_9PLAT